MSTASISAVDNNATWTELAESTASEKIRNGNAYDYMIEVWQKRHHGDLIIGKVLLLSIGCQSITNSKGIHVQLTGTGGGGKSDAAQQMIKLIDPKYVLKSALTPQVLYYPTKDLVDGTTVFVDDNVWNSDLGVSIKRITSEFQEGAERTVTTDGKGKKEKSNKRLTFLVTSVDSQCDEQIRDRFIMMDVDETPEHIKGIIETLQEQDTGTNTNPGESFFETQVCWAITRNLKTLLVDVEIPFAKRINFTGAPRAYRMFSDMIKCFAIFSHMKREKDSYGRIMAIEADFDNAKELYEAIGGHDRDKYTTAETKLLKAIYDSPNHFATKTDIQKVTKLSVTRIGDILNGRSDGDQQKYGLLSKCTALVVNDTRKPYTYTLPEGFSVDGFCQVTLNEEK